MGSSGMLEMTPMEPFPISRNSDILPTAACCRSANDDVVEMTDRKDSILCNAISVGEAPASCSSFCSSLSACCIAIAKEVLRLLTSVLDVASDVFTLRRRLWDWTGEPSRGRRGGEDMANKNLY